MTCPEHVINALRVIRDTLNVIAGIDPFSNTGMQYNNNVFEVEAYSWDDEGQGQDYNFKWKDIEVSWYKHLLRGTIINREVSQEEALEMMKECVKSLNKDIDVDYDVDFTPVDADDL